VRVSVVVKVVVVVVKVVVVVVVISKKSVFFVRTIRCDMIAIPRAYIV